MLQSTEIRPGPWTRAKNFSSNLLAFHADAVAVVLVLVGFVLRVVEASQTYLNPDEGMFFGMSLPAGFLDTLQASRGTHHPPLLVFILHYIGKVSQTELALRTVPIIAGSLFPWVIYRWFGSVWNKLAALLALTILTFSPNLISLSAQARGYTLALLLLAISLSLLDRAIRERSVSRMTAFSAVLCVATFVEYFVAFFIGAAGVYFLVCVFRRQVPRKMLLAWVAGQVAILGAYVFHYVTHIRTMMTSEFSMEALHGWLCGAFPRPGENLLLFFVRGSVKQVAYLCSSIPIGGAVMFVAVLAGIGLLWSSLDREHQAHSRPLAVFFLAAFLLAFAGSVAQIHPYGRSRHTVFLAMFIAPALGVVLDRLLRARAWSVLPAILVMTPLWHAIAVGDQNNIPWSRHRLKDMRAGVEFMYKTIPSGATVLLDMNDKMTVDYYLGPGGYWLGTNHRKPFHLIGFLWAGLIPADLPKYLAEVRKTHNLDSAEPIWVLDTGWDISQPRAQNVRAFGGALVVYWFVSHPRQIVAGATSADSRTAR